MATKLKNLSKILNPNWTQLQERLKINGSDNIFSKHSNKSNTETSRSILGKRKERSNEEPQAPKPNPLIPISSDCCLTDMVAMDCEMVGVSSLGNKSALGRVTLVNKWGNVVYDEYVRPLEYVVDFRTEISGIRPRDLKKAKDFNIVQKKVAEMVDGKILVGHALHNDLKALLLTHPKKDIRDTAQYAPFLKEGRSRSLKNLAAEFLSVDIQNGEHCPVEDARAAMMLYQRNRKQWEKSAKDFKRLKEKQKKRKPKKKKFTAEG
ncbi:RNA exonuclease 4-like [Salvia divinorum]|uniref:RNA exonuclease 4 n=1 Tax=Salvia divinorum TaxID=28513 RepID=A0ABD1G1F2_SALDI